MIRTAYPRNLLFHLARETKRFCFGRSWGGDSEKGFFLKLRVLPKWMNSFGGEKGISNRGARFRIAITGALGVAIGVVSILQNLEGSIGILLLATASVWIGFDGLLKALIASPIGSELQPNCLHRLASTESNESNHGPFSCHGREACFGSVAEIVSKLTDRSAVQAAAILWPKQSGWIFKAGSKCSARVGASLANQISRHAFPLDRQSLCKVQMMDRQLEALVTPGPIKSGQYFLLVTVYSVESSSNEDEWLIARHAVLDVSFILGLIYGDARKHRSAFNLPFKQQSSKESIQGEYGRRGDSGKLLTCCSICEDVCASCGGNSQNWQPWTHWLNDVLGISISHTICNRCAHGYYECE